MRAPRRAKTPEVADIRPAMRKLETTLAELNGKLDQVQTTQIALDEKLTRVEAQTTKP